MEKSTDFSITPIPLLSYRVALFDTSAVPATYLSDTPEALVVYVAIAGFAGGESLVLNAKIISQFYLIFV